MSGEDALTSVAEDLYGLPLGEFTSARNDRARQVRGEDRELAERISELRRPSQAAWIVNQLVRHRLDSLEDALDLGEELRAAQDDRDAAELSRLTRERRRVVADLAGEGGRLAEELGQRAGAPALDGVSKTIQAAMTDAAAADALRTGRLVRELVAEGFDPVDLEDAVAGDAVPSRSSSRPKARRSSRPSTTAETPGTAESDDAAQRERERRREKAERAARDAEKRAAEASEAAEKLRDRFRGLDSDLDDLRAERATLEDRLRDVVAEIASAEREVRSARREYERAADTAERAETAAAEARQVEDLNGG